MRVICPNQHGAGMGFLPALIGAASSVYAAKKGGGAPAGTPGASPVPGLPTSGGGSTTVSPTIQTQISPQISPVFQQTGSGDQAASTTMVSPGGQTAVPAPSTPPGSTYGSPTPAVYNDPYTRDFDITRYVPPGVTASEQMTAMKGNPYLWPAVIGGTVIVALVLFAPPRKR